jgi:hypothetical protein
MLLPKAFPALNSRFYVAGMENKFFVILRDQLGAWQRARYSSAELWERSIRHYLETAELDTSSLYCAEKY